MLDTLSEAVRNLSRLGQQADQFTIDCARGEPAMRLGLVTTLYFKQGHTPQTRRGVEACFALFYKAFRPLLQWQSYQRLRKLSPSGFAKCRRQVVDAPADQALLWSISSATPRQVASHRMFVMSTTEAQRDTDLSCLKMTLPWSILSQKDGAKIYEGWIRFLCSQIMVEHGYGGLACILPDEGLQYLPQEYRLAQHHAGLMVDAGPHIESLRLLERIKGVSWYTVLGTRFVSKLGGSDRLRGTLSTHSQVVFHAHEHGLMIRAGALPELGSKGEAPPRAYVIVNKVLRPVCVRDTGCLHPCLVSGVGFTEKTTAQWYARFDEKPRPAVSAGQPCPHAGHWFSSARARSRRFFKQGEVMPAFEHLKAGRTQWYWAEEVG